MYLTVFMDSSTRGIRGWHLSRHLDQSLTLTAWRRALAQHRPEMHHADQGGQYAATASIHTRQAHGIQISMAAIGEATEHGDAERRMGTIQEAEVTRHKYADVHEAYPHLGHFLEAVYQTQRLHAALGDLTPAAVETQWRQRLRATKPVQCETP